MKTYESLHETLSFYGINCHQPYYISSGNPIFNFPKTPFRIDFYALCICTAGNITVEIDNREYHISKNGLLISAPSTILKFLNIGKEFRMKLLFFEKNFLLKNISNPFFLERLGLFNQASFNVITSDDQHSDKLSKLLEYLHLTTKRKGRFTEDIIRTIIFNLLLEVAEIALVDKDNTIQEQDDNNCLFFKFSQLAQQEAFKHKDVKYYAEKLFVSNKYLINIVKRASGKTPHQIIDECLLKETYILLANPELTISDIAYDAGFNSVSAFGRFFKKYASISPSEYRKQQHV
ncbi:AraC family transcriptional regulator [Pseudopedobacter beijingensis]|uniref:AraC family transcriptional regulator n=1 Tax=Pseudopedobacter beijingensis TaxID=1207056 RepID=A0ABW4IBK9_9SPHI